MTATAGRRRSGSRRRCRFRRSNNNNYCYGRHHQKRCTTSAPILRKQDANDASIIGCCAGHRPNNKSSCVPPILDCGGGKLAITIAHHVGQRYLLSSTSSYDSRKITPPALPDKGQEGIDPADHTIHPLLLLSPKTPPFLLCCTSSSTAAAPLDNLARHY
mmetsp:Transcript_11321/g.18934  ORF Transcript_11321/g.18934 Transcript_11321/m.18934 type:complete len:160 (+) Transcript_11321:591-1070(+)